MNGSGGGSTQSADAQITIKIGGSKVSPQFMRALREVTVDTSLHLPAMFTIQLLDANATWTDNTSLLKIGNPVEISIKAAMQGGRSGSEATIIKGEITSLEPHFESFGSVMLNIIGYDKGHRLHRGRKTKTFLKMSDGDIVAKLGRETGLSVTRDATAIKHDYVMQHNCTDWEFLQQRAARIGYRLYVNGTTLYFKKSDATPTAVPDLKWGVDLLRFQPRLTALQQSETVKVRAWDPKTKKEIAATSSTKTLVPTTGLGADPATASIFGAADWVSTNAPMATQDEATAMANALSNDASGRAIHAEGEALGEPKLVAGTKVKIDGVGTRFGGTYTVTAATHHYETGGRYITTFTVSGREASTLYQLLQNTASVPNRIEGVVIGLVTNNNDPDKKGRVKVKFPWLSDTEESNWARMASPMAGATRGFFFMPEVNDEVLVAFEQGDVNYPYVVGALWNGKDAPPLSAYTGSDGKIKQRIIKTTTGHQIILSDEAGKESIKVVDKTGKNSIFIDSVKNDMALEADGNISITAKGKITLSAQMDVSIESKTGKLVAKGSTGAEVTTPAQVKISGNGGAEVSTTANMSVKGSIVQIQSSGPATVKGNPIMLN